MLPNTNHRSLVLCFLLTGCMPAVVTPTPPVTTVGPVSAQQPQRLPDEPVVQPGSSTRPDSPSLNATRVVAVFPEGALQALRSGLRTVAAIDPADLSMADLKKFVVTLNGQVVPADQITYEAPTLDDAGQVVITLTINGRSLSTSDRLKISLPSGKLTLIANGGTGTLTVPSTAAVLLTDQLASLGQGTLALPPTAIQRLTARLVSAFLASTPGDPLQSPAFRYAVATMSKALSGGASESVLASLDLNQPSSGGGGGGGAAPAPAPANVNGQVNGTNGALTPANAAGATIN